MKLLFERLGESWEYRRDYTLRAAIQAQLARLVATHLRLDPEREPDLVNYGLPSVVSLAVGNAAELARYAERLRELVERNEPRLVDVRIAIEAAAGHAAPPRLVIEARLHADDDPEPFRFPVAPLAH